MHTFSSVILQSFEVLGFDFLLLSSTAVGTGICTVLASVCSSFKGSEAAKASVDNSTSNGDKFAD